MAAVQEVRSASRSPGTIVVRFAVDGRPVDARIPRSWSAPESVGETIRVEYSPDDPTVARKAGSHDVLLLLWLVGVAVALLDPAVAGRPPPGLPPPSVVTAAARERFGRALRPAAGAGGNGSDRRRRPRMAGPGD